MRDRCRVCQLQFDGLDADIVAQSLRDEVESLKAQVQEHLLTISAETNARMVAEEDAERLKSDLEALLPGSEQDGSWFLRNCRMNCYRTIS